MKSEIEALDHNDGEEPGTLQTINRRIMEMIGDQEAVLLNGRWKIYAPPNTWSGLDVARLREEEPSTYDKYFVRRKPTGSRRLTIYALHNWKEDRASRG